MKYRFKQAETDAEFAQIARLNHATFAEELGQYTPLPEGVLVDKFHSKNTYVIALADERVVGMIAIHFEPPYSVAEKLADPGILAPLGRISEIRLLAIEPEFRKGAVLAGLCWSVFDRSRDCDTMVISGREEELKMYRTIGFAPIGPAVPSGNAMFVPMAAAIPDLLAKWQGKFRLNSSAA